MYTYFKRSSSDVYWNDFNCSCIY